MYSTMPSLLIRSRQPDSKEAWNRFVELYTPFLVHLLVNRMCVQARTRRMLFRRSLSRLRGRCLASITIRIRVDFAGTCGSCAFLD